MRYFIYLQYDGTPYHGWQRQPDAISVQQVIEEKLSILLGTTTPILGAGRTDTGVHARLMVAHFDSETPIDCDTIAFKLNGLLPPSIAIKRIVPVAADAHARFSATARTYRYYVTTHKDVFRPLYTMRTFFKPDLERMNEAAERLYHYDDFTSFAKLHTDVKTNICHVTLAHWTETAPGEYVFVIRADRFLRNMVRAIVGTLLQVGRGRLTVEEFCQVIERKNRCSAGDSVAASGLFLEEIEYPDSIFITPKAPSDTTT